MILRSVRFGKRVYVAFLPDGFLIGYFGTEAEARKALADTEAVA